MKADTLQTFTLYINSTAFIQNAHKRPGALQFCVHKRHTDYKRHFSSLSCIMQVGCGMNYVQHGFVSQLEKNFIESKLMYTVYNCLVLCTHDIYSRCSQFLSLHLICDINLQTCISGISHLIQLSDIWKMSLQLISLFDTNSFVL